MVSSRHIFLDCTFARSVLRRVNLRRPLHPGSLYDVFSYMKESIFWNDDELLLFVLVCHELFNARRSGRLGIPVPMEVVVANVQANQANGILEHSFLLCMDNGMPYPDGESKWRLPPTGFLKLNLAGTCVGVTHHTHTAVAAVVRKWCGSFIGGLVEHLPHYSGSKLKAIPMALRTSLTWCIGSLNLRGADIVVDIPQRLIANYLNGAVLSEDVEVDYDVLGDCLLLGKRFRSIEFQYCEDQCNFVAQNLARRAYKWYFGVGTWFSIPPPWMVNALNKDYQAASINADNRQQLQHRPNPE